MLNLDAAFELSGLPSVLVVPDDRIAGGHSALARQPRLAMSDGGPEVSLLVYGTTEENTFTATGGVLSLTTTLELDEAEEQAVRAALAERAAAEAAGSDAAGPDTAAAATQDRPPVVLLAPSWQAGRVELDMLGDLHLTATPSLLGGSRCSFQHKLDAGQATALAEDWPATLGEVIARYELTLPARPGQRARMDQYHEASATSGSQRYAVRAEVHATSEPVAAAEQRLVLEGPLHREGMTMDGTMQRVELPGGSPAGRGPR